MLFLVCAYIESVFGQVGSIVFVIDAQDDETYSEAIEYFLQMAKIAYEVNPNIGFDVLIHKVDGDSYLSNDRKVGTSFVYVFSCHALLQ